MVVCWQNQQKKKWQNKKITSSTTYLNWYKGRYRYNAASFVPNPHPIVRPSLGKLYCRYVLCHCSDCVWCHLILERVVTAHDCSYLIRYGFLCIFSLTHLVLEKKAAISQTTSLYAFSWMKSFVFWFEFQWSFLLGVQLKIRPCLIRPKLKPVSKSVAFV